MNKPKFKNKKKILCWFRHRCNNELHIVGLTKKLALVFVNHNTKSLKAEYALGKSCACSRILFKPHTSTIFNHRVFSFIYGTFRYIRKGSTPRKKLKKLMKSGNNIPYIRQLINLFFSAEPVPKQKYVSFSINRLQLFKYLENDTPVISVDLKPYRFVFNPQSNELRSKGEWVSSVDAIINKLEEILIRLIAK